MSIVENALSKAKFERPAPIERAAAVDKPPERSAELAILLEARPSLELSIERLREIGIAPPAPDERRMMAEYRAIKRGLLAPLSQRTDRHIELGNVIMVASAVPGEGKTFTSFNLATSLATERDWTTILVDADCARQHLSASLGVKDAPGLLDVLSDRGRTTDVIFRTSIPRLLFVPAGSSKENATELMASTRMSRVIDELLRLHPRTLIIFDSSPILATPESRALADVVGQIVLVVKAESTPREQVQAAVEALGEGHQIGVVLNQFEGPAPQAEYYGTYGASQESTRP